MTFLLISSLLLIVAYPMMGLGLSVWLLLASQLMLVIREVKTKQVSGVGAFIFMSFLFFGIRPLHLLIENDTKLFTQLFLIRFDTTILTESMWWATLALWCFAACAYLAPRLQIKYFRKRKSKVDRQPLQLSSQRGEVMWLVFFQIIALVVMVGLALSGKALYRTAAGAYIYDFPIVLQAVQIFAVVALFCRYIGNKNFGSLMALCVSVGLLLIFTLLMRNVSNFRSFYITGLVAVFIAILQRMNLRWGYAALLIPILALQPAFRYLGEARRMSNEEMDVNELVEAALPSQNLGQAYWDFYNYGGDMNIFDTFTAAKQTQPHFKPYIWSWLYVPLHFVPRAFWKEKPEKGMTMDVSFTRGAPYSPGIAGFFLRDGGLLWMLLCMGVLGYLVSFADWYVLTMPRGRLQYCLVGILAVNGLLLSRVFLWQYFYQVLYMTIPCIALNWWLNRGVKRSRVSKFRKKPSSPVLDERLRLADR